MQAQTDSRFPIYRAKTKTLAGLTELLHLLERDDYEVSEHSERVYDELLYLRSVLCAWAIKSK